MKSLRIQILALTVASVCLSGCMSSKFSRLIPENKDANVYIVSPVYGTMVIQTRVSTGTNTLGPLNTTIPTLSVGH